MDIGLPKPEEFPRFCTFWIERPEQQARSIRAWALLDGPRVTGAYEFLITPGVEQTALDIECQLFFRKQIAKLGVAPMSSMWAWDTASQPTKEKRPHVHDSDGLLIAGANGEWLWRPLARRKQVSVSRFQFDGLKGFGLMQRDREPDHYRDDEARYHLRPSIWIKPRQPWGAGAVELLELPSGTEWEDNIAACWVPQKPVRAGDVLAYAYQVAFAAHDPVDHRGGRFVTTQVESPAKVDTRFKLTIQGTALRSLPADTVLEPVVTTNRGQVQGAACSKLPGGDWQLRFGLRRQGDGPAELRAFVRRGGKVLTETWSYLCN